MKHYDYEEAAKILNYSIPHLKRKLRDNNIKRFSDAPRSPYVITDRTLEVLKNAPNKPGMAIKRCEPCQHTLKKFCSACKRSICIKDYRRERTGLPAARCKDCELAAKHAARKK